MSVKVLPAVDATGLADVRPRCRPRARQLPAPLTVCCLTLAALSFGAARMQASEISGGSVTISTVAFQPQTFAPAAFADWDHAPSADASRP